MSVRVERVRNNGSGNKELKRENRILEFCVGSGS